MNYITIELCAEDRQRLDRVIRAMEMVTGIGTIDAAPEAPGIVEPIVDEAAVVQEAPKTEPPKKNTPHATLEDVQAAVVRLTAAGRKAEARAIVLAYAERISAIPEDKLDEALQRLQALEG